MNTVNFERILIKVISVVGNEERASNILQLDINVSYVGDGRVDGHAFIKERLLYD